MKVFGRIQDMIQKFINFLKEVKVELKKVNWLSLNQTIRYTLLVILISIVVAAFLGMVDFLVTLLIDKFVL